MEHMGGVYSIWHTILGMIKPMRPHSFTFGDGDHDKTNRAGENPFEHGVAWTY
jgi:hypothetical protein